MSVIARRRRVGITSGCVLLSCTPLAAHADAMIPYMVVPWGQLFLLPLVIIVEAAILRAFFGGGVLVILFQSFVANVASTIVGAIVYVGTMSIIEGEALFAWWFKGAWGTEALRSAVISLSFATALWAISWAVESLVIAKMRKVPVATVAKPCAIANVVTYVLLLALALWFGGLGK